MAIYPYLAQAYDAYRKRDVESALSALGKALVDGASNSVLRQIGRLVEGSKAPLPEPVEQKAKARRGQTDRSILSTEVIEVEGFYGDVKRYEVTDHATKGPRYRRLPAEDAPFLFNFFFSQPPRRLRRAERVPQSVYLNGPGKSFRRKQAKVQDQSAMLADLGLGFAA